MSELRIGDTLWVQTAKGQFGTQGNDALGLLLGLITGDGHFTNRGKGQEAAIVSLWNEERVLAETLCQTITGLISGLSLAPRDYAVKPVSVPSRNMVFIRSVLLARALESLGFGQQTKLRIPEVVWRGSEPCVKAYLRALFQTDGTVYLSSDGDTCSVRLNSSHRPLLRDVQMLLSNFGVFTRIHLRRDAGGRALPDGRGGNRGYFCQAQHELIIEGESRDVFMREVGFLLPGKTARYQAWVSGKALLKHQRFEARVTSIVNIGSQPVFDTTQPDHNTVIFNGLVTGQCGEQPLPTYGCCCLGSIDLTHFVTRPFEDDAAFDEAALVEVVTVATRMLDNVLDVTVWPLPQQQQEARNKRRVGLGFTGLGDALVMLNLRYDSDAARERWRGASPR